MKVILDKIEEKIATVELENGEMLNVPYILLDGAKEGDIIEIIVKKDDTKEREKYMNNLANKLFEE